MADDSLRVYLRGRLAITRGDTIVLEGALPGRQGRRLWANLVLNRVRPVEAELAEREAETLLALDPPREPSYHLLMRALTAGGNPAPAARVFESCGRVLREQAGTDG